MLVLARFEFSTQQQTVLKVSIRVLRIYHRPEGFHSISKDGRATLPWPNPVARIYSGFVQTTSHRMPVELMAALLCGHRTLIGSPHEESALIGLTVLARFQLLLVSLFGRVDIREASESRCLRLRFPQKK